MARALVSDARVIVFDEPTSSLTEHDAERLFAVIDRLSERGLAVVYISHFLEEVRRVAERYTVLRDGRSVARGDLADTSLEAIIAPHGGPRPRRTVPARPARRRASRSWSCGSLATRTRRSRRPDVRRGEILGIAGLVGAGRTELLRAVFGLDPVVSGQVRVEDVSRRPARRRGAGSRRGSGFLSEDRKGEGLALGVRSRTT